MSGVNTSPRVTVRYFAAARAAAGVESEHIEVAANATVADLLTAVGARRGAELTKILERCSFLVDEVAVRDRTAPLPDGATIDILPPFAGG